MLIKVLLLCKALWWHDLHSGSIHAEYLPPPPSLSPSPRYTCRTLFERHKLLFSFQMCAKILETSGKLNMDEYNFFLRGGVVSWAEGVSKCGVVEVGDEGKYDEDSRPRG